MAGYSTLLEAWIYERFTSFRPTHNVKYRNTMSCAQRWLSWGKGVTLETLQSYREVIDSLTANDVIWNPYSDIRQRFPFPRVALYHGCLSVGTVVEPYNPARVLR